MTTSQNSFSPNRGVVSIATMIGTALVGAALLSTPVAYAQTTTAQAANPQCVTERVRHRHGPPTKGLYHTDDVMKCDGVEFAAFERGQTVAPACVPTQVTRRYGPPGKGWKRAATEMRCANQ